ncbi:hypothetical protein C8Q80DRAFT_1264181 [Daedaleopsis nitida]|nr:hypothetical protein C8Q80DRAFT_1264181 [Daedaleopsis nitida]
MALRTLDLFNHIPLSPLDSDTAPNVVLLAEESEEDDPIEAAFRKARREPGEIETEAALVRELETKWTAKVQIYRRLILHDAVLANKAFDKASLLDIFHSQNFTLDDSHRLFRGVRVLGDSLIWWKDAYLDALHIRPSAHKRRDADHTSSGAIRDGPEDPFCKAFLAELRARPDLFIVVNHSVTHHSDGEVENFGGPTGETYYHMRARTFEALALLAAPSGGDAGWNMFGRSLRRSMYPRKIAVPKRVLVAIPNGDSYMYTHVAFPVRYVVVIDVTPNTDGQELTTNVVWAAFRVRALRPVRGWEITPDRCRNRGREASP